MMMMMMIMIMMSAWHAVIKAVLENVIDNWNIKRPSAVNTSLYLCD
jgi:hypothetical protein